MADALPPANGAKSIQGNIHTIQRTGAAFQNIGAARQPSQQRPKSSDCDFRESRRWAKRNEEWIDDDSELLQPTIYRRRASEDLLRSKPLPAAPPASDTEQHPNHHLNPSSAESLEQTNNPSCLSRSLNTGNWLNIRRDSAQRKIQLHQQLGRFVRKITDTSNWASKEPTPSLEEPQEQDESDRLTQATLKIKPKRPSNRGVAKLNKKPGMDNIRARKEAAAKAAEEDSDLADDGIINPNSADDPPTRCKKIPALRDEDIEETKRKSADLREVLSEYQSDRHGNLLPEINTDTMGDLGIITQERQEQHAISEPAVETYYSAEKLLGINSVDSTVWKTSNPSSGTSIQNKSLSLPRPGPRSSGRHNGLNSKYSAVSGPARTPRNGSPESLVTVVQPPRIATSKDQPVAVQPRRSTSTDSFSAFGGPLTTSTDTLTIIANEALDDSRPLMRFILTDAEPVAVQPSPRPTILHSGLVSSGKAPSDAPNRPLPDLPEVPTPESSETSRREAGSRASSPSGQSLQRKSTQSTQRSHKRRASSLASIASLDGVLQGTTSPYGSPQRNSKSANKTGSGRSSLQKRSGVVLSLTDAHYRELIAIRKTSEGRSPGLRQAHDLSASASTGDAIDTMSRDQRIHNKRLQDVASARARRRRTATREGHQSSQEAPMAEDFPPPPPSARPPTQTAVDRQHLDLKSRVQTANTSAVYLPNGGSLPTTQAERTSLTSDVPSLACQVQTSQTSTAGSCSHAESPVPVPASLSLSIPRTMETQKSRRGHSSLCSNMTPANSPILHGTPTPALSEALMPSSDDEGTGVVGVTDANKAKIPKRLRLSAGDLAAMIADMHSMRQQLNGQTRKIQAQSKQIRAIEMQKLRIVEAVNALVAVLSEPPSMVPVSSPRPVMSPGAYPHLGWPDRDSVTSMTNTGASADSASSRSRSSDLTFITEPEALGNGLMSQEGKELNMDFDRLQELIRLDRRKVGFGTDQEGKWKRPSRKSGSSAVGYVRSGA